MTRQMQWTFSHDLLRGSYGKLV